MTLNTVGFAVAAYATYRVVRLLLTDDVFARPRDAFHDWLQAGQTLPARQVGLAGVWIAAAFAVAFLVARAAPAATGGVPWVTADETKWAVTAAVAVGLLSAVVGCRNWVYDLVTCQFCLGVWVSAVGVLVLSETVLDLRFVTGVAFALAVAAAQTFLHLLEDALIGAIEALDHYNHVHRERRNAEAQARAARRESGSDGPR